MTELANGSLVNHFLPTPLLILLSLPLSTVVSYLPMILHARKYTPGASSLLQSHQRNVVSPEGVNVSRQCVNLDTTLDCSLGKQLWIMYTLGTWNNLLPCSSIQSEWSIKRQHHQALSVSVENPVENEQWTKWVQTTKEARVREHCGKHFHYLE